MGFVPRPELTPIPMSIHNMRSGKTPLQYSQDFGPSPLAGLHMQTSLRSRQHNSVANHMYKNGDEAQPAGPSESISSTFKKPLQLTDLLDAQPALAQVAALEAALEAVMAGLEDASAAAQPQLDAAAGARQAVTDLISAEGL